MNATMLSDGVRKLAFVMSTFTDRLVEAFEARRCARAELGAVLRGPGGKIGHGAGIFSIVRESIVALRERMLYYRLHVTKTHGGTR